MERIAAAAIELEGKVWVLPAPARHIHVMQEIWKDKGIDSPLAETPWHLLVGYENQGFLTSSGRFVDRLEAAKIAMEAGQIKWLRWPPKLYSEDLW